MATSSDVEACAFEDIFELAADARDDGVYAQDRGEDAQWFRVPENGMICLWEPGNRSSTKRISHRWVRPDARDHGVGRALFERAFQAAKESDCDTLDIYVYNTDLVEEYGFEERPESSQAMDDARYYVFDF